MQTTFAWRETLTFDRITSPRVARAALGAVPAATRADADVLSIVADDRPAMVWAELTEQPLTPKATTTRAELAARWPAGRVAIGLVIAVWLVIALATILGWVNWDAAAFLGAAVFTFAIAAVLSFDAVIDLLDPDESGSLPDRFQPEQAVSWLERAPTTLRIIAVPAFFAAGTVIGHFLWH